MDTTTEKLVWLIRRQETFVSPFIIHTHTGDNTGL